MRAFTGFLALAAALVPATSFAQSKGAVSAEIRSTHTLVLENYDLGDYVGARDQLLAAIAKAEKAELGQELVNVKSHAMLAGVYLLGFRDEAKAIEHFKVVLKIAPGYELEKPFDTDPVKQAMAKADAIINPVITCENLRGIDHKQVLQAREGEPINIAFKGGVKLRKGTAHVHYRAPRGSRYVELNLQARGKCEYAGEIPAEAVTGEQLYYFVSMKKKDDGRFIAMRGNAKSPYPIQIQRTAAKEPEVEAKTRAEVPDELDFSRPKPRGGGCAGCVAGTRDSDVGSGLLGLAVLAFIGWRRRDSAATTPDRATPQQTRPPMSHPRLPLRPKSRSRCCSSRRRRRCCRKS